MSSPSSGVNSDAAMVQGRPLSSENNEQAVLDGMKGMHLTSGNSSHPTTGGMGETTAKQSNKHNNAGKPAQRYLSFIAFFSIKNNICLSSVFFE